MLSAVNSASTGSFAYLHYCNHALISIGHYSNAAAFTAPSDQRSKHKSDSPCLLLLLVERPKHRTLEVSSLLVSLRYLTEGRIIKAVRVRIAGLWV